MKSGQRRHNYLKISQIANSIQAWEQSVGKFQSFRTCRRQTKKRFAGVKVRPQCEQGGSLVRHIRGAHTCFSGNWSTPC